MRRNPPVRAARPGGVESWLPALRFEEMKGTLLHYNRRLGSDRCLSLSASVSRTTARTETGAASLELRSSSLRPGGRASLSVLSKPGWWIKPDFVKGKSCVYRASCPPRPSRHGQALDKWLSVVSEGCTYLAHRSLRFFFFFLHCVSEEFGHLGPSCGSHV